LVDKTTSLYSRVTLTDNNGHYAFHDISNTSNYQVILVQDAFLRPETRSSNNFLRANTFIVFGEPVYGAAQDIPSNGVSNFALLLDDEQVPLYYRPADATGFEGDAKGVAYWSFQTTGTNRRISFSPSRIAAIKSAAAALIANGGSCTASITSSDPLQSNLATAALNIAAGKGIFEPYDFVQWWYFQFARHVVCDLSSPSSTDYNLALTFVQAINNAGDMDRNPHSP